MFRQRILERRNQPDAFDQLLVVVTPRSVLALLALLGVLLAVLVWSVTARIPVKVDGQGILMRPGYVTKLHSSAEGRIASLMAAPGTEIAAGETIAKLSQPSMERELDRLNAQFDIRKSFSERQISLAQRTRQLERSLSEARREEIAARLESLEALRTTAVEQRGLALADRREKLARIEAFLSLQAQEQSERMDGLDDLASQGFINKNARLSGLSAFTSSAIEKARVELQISETRLSEIAAIEDELRLISDIQNVRAELIRMDIQEQHAERLFQDLVRAEQESLEEVAARIRSVRQQLSAARGVVSPFDAVVLERLVDEGDLIAVGSAIAMLRLAPQEPFLRISLSSDAALGTFSIALEGFQSDPLAPDASGEDIAEVLSALPVLEDWDLAGSGSLAEGSVDVRFKDGPEGRSILALSAEIRDRDLWTADGRPATGSVQILGVEAPDVPMVHMGFFPVGLAKQISPGHEIRIDPSSAPRERFGSLVGEVTKLSDFAITDAGMLQVVGNSQVAKSLAGPGGVILVEAALNVDPDDPNRFEWTSKSPNFPMTEGTTTTARVVVEHRTPISFVIPLLRRWILGQGSPTAAEAIQRGGQ